MLVIVLKFVHLWLWHNLVLYHVCFSTIFLLYVLPKYHFWDLCMWWKVITRNKSFVNEWILCLYSKHSKSITLKYSNFMHKIIFKNDHDHFWVVVPSLLISKGFFWVVWARIFCKLIEFDLRRGFFYYMMFKK